MLCSISGSFGVLEIPILLMSFYLLSVFYRRPRLGHVPTRKGVGPRRELSPFFFVFSIAVVAVTAAASGSVFVSVSVVVAASA